MKGFLAAALAALALATGLWSPPASALEVVDERGVSVELVQRTVDRGTVLEQSGDEAVVIEQLAPYSVEDASATVLRMPYPVRVTRPPVVTIIDRDALRRWYFRKLRWATDRKYKILNNFYFIAYFYFFPIMVFFLIYFFGNGKLVNE